MPPAPETADSGPRSGRGEAGTPARFPGTVGTTTSREITARLESAGLAPRWIGEPPETLAGVADDSRRVERDDLFCAVPGFRVDGHDFVERAFRAGAAAALVERALPAAGGPLLRVRDARRGTAVAASVFHGDPGSTLGVFGVTGTNGKTTTVWILRHLLNPGEDAASIGTLGIVGPDGRRRSGELTTPGPVDLARALAALRDRGARRVALEVSSHALDQRRVDGIEFKGMVFTNLSREHLDYHSDMDAYRRAKLRAETLVRAEGVCAVDAGEPAWEGVGAGRRRVTYGPDPDAEVRAEDLELRRSGSRWRLVAGEDSAEVTFPLPGEFNVRNALGAAAIALVEGGTVGGVAERLSSTPQVPGRMEVLARRPALIVRDYAHTPDALERALGQLAPEKGRLVVVFGCGGDRDPGKRPLMGRVAGRLADLALITTDNPRSEDPAEIAARVVEGMEAGRGGRAGEHEVVLDRREAIARALERAGPGDVVLLAGKGHETYQILGDRREPFDEAEIVSELLGEGAP